MMKVDPLCSRHITWLEISSVGLALQIRARFLFWIRSLPGKGWSLFVPNDPSESWESLIFHWFYNIFEGAVAWLFLFLGIQWSRPTQTDPSACSWHSAQLVCRTLFSRGFQRDQGLHRKIPHAAKRDSVECTMFHLPGHAKTLVFTIVFMVCHGDSWVRRRRPLRFFFWPLPSTLL